MPYWELNQHGSFLDVTKSRCFFSSPDIKTTESDCFLFSTEKDSPCYGEGGRGGEEQNHRELENSSEDTAHEVK